MEKKVIVIIGGSRGIGKFLVNSLAPDNRVCTCSLGTMERKTGNFLSMKCDAGKHKDVYDFIKATLREFHTIDIMIYNAGVMLFDDLLNVKEIDIDLMYETMVKGYLFMCQEIIPIMRGQGYGHIINISSTRGFTVAPGKSAYSAMKRAATSLTDSIRIENEQYGIIVSSLHFGLVNTASSRERYKEALDNLHPIEQSDVLKSVEYVISLTPNAHVNSIVVGGKL